MSIKNSLPVGVVLSLSLVLLQGCSQDFAIKKVQIPNLCSGANGAIYPAVGATCNGVSSNGSPTPTSTPIKSPTVNLGQKLESFPMADLGQKKIDLLFVVDDSSSMGPYQANLANGFAAIAETFYRRADLDICTAVISSSRYLGKTTVVNSNTITTEYVNIGCTQPVGSEIWSQQEKDRHISNLIADFKAKVNFGIKGSGSELLGKSLVSFLYNADTWNNNISTNAVKNPFFRPGATADISFLSDENNYFRYPNTVGAQDANVAYNPDKNDLPAVKNQYVKTGLDSSPLMQAFFEISSGISGTILSTIWHNEQDTNMGIKDHLDLFFQSLNPSMAPNYSVTSVVSSNTRAFDIPSRAINLAAVPGLVGRSSAMGLIEGSAQDYANLYNGVTQSLVNRAYQFTLSKPVYKADPSLVSVSIVRSNGIEVTLNSPADFSLSATGSELILNQNSSLVKTIAAGDQLKVSYSYLLP
jgi:hypothetical protein